MRRIVEIVQGVKVVKVAKDIQDRITGSTG
jgi:hypothetical protein